ncbi:hypothetical protein HU200_003899 [Digitaria exilis]|uniref:Uncharacterized protein n=1 Tax=Digitaria exilis TaxID=1010633 RepID=A0A835FWX4_9POAL|nr:hypothetical protein HU200_003899 [Digitaria exilis]
MLPGKVAVLLVVLAIISLDPVSGGGCCSRTLICTEKQKNHIVKTCKPHILKSDRRSPATKAGACCQAVRELQAINEGMMQCVFDRFTAAEKEKYFEQAVTKILKNYCTQVSSFVRTRLHPRQVKIITFDHPSDKSSENHATIE